MLANLIGRGRVGALLVMEHSGQVALVDRLLAGAAAVKVADSPAAGSPPCRSPMNLLSCIRTAEPFWRVLTQSLDWHRFPSRLNRLGAGGRQAPHRRFGFVRQSGTVRVPACCLQNVRGSHNLYSYLP